MYRTPQADSESDDERASATLPSSTNHNAGPNRHDAFGPPILNKQTPDRPKLPTASSASSSGSSSTTSSTWDRDSTRTGTPFTPPISEAPDSSNANKTRLASHGKLPANFVERCVDASNISSTTHTSAAKRSSQALSASELLVERMKNLSVQDDDEASNTRGSLGLDKSPTPAGRAHRKQRGRQAAQGGDDYFQFPTNNGKSNRKNTTGDDSRTNEMASTEPKVQRTLNLASNTLRSRKRNGSETPSLVIAQTDSEGEEVDADSSGMTAQNLPLSGQNQGRKATLSTPRVSHKRSKSTPGPHNTHNPIAQDSPAAATSSRNVSPPQSNGVHPSLLDPARATEPRSKRRTSTGATPPAPTRRSLRRRSTGSLEPEQSVVPSIESRSPAEVERMPGAFPIEPFNISRASRQRSSCEPAETTPDLEPDETRKFPKLEHKHPIKKNKIDLKNKILRIIRRRKGEKNPNLDHGYVYIFKSEAFPGYVKIGSTKQAPEEREKQWQTKCKFHVTHISEENEKSFRFYGTVERIVHAELYNEQRCFHCERCGTGHVPKLAKKGQEKLPKRTEHSEWFEISEKKAKEVVNKWRDWVIHQEPYKHDATLRSCWLWKHDMGTKWLKGTETDWEAWRQFDWLDKILLGWYHFNQWLGEVSPPLQKLVNSSGSVFVLAAGFHLWTFGVNLASCLRVVMALLLYRFICFKFC